MNHGPKNDQVQGPDSQELRGIYLPVDVARYMVVTMPSTSKWPLRSQRVLRWIRHGLIAPEQRNEPGRRLAIDFDDLVTCQVITLLREAGFSLQRIRSDEAKFSKILGVSKPYAHHDFWADFPDILTKVDGRLLSGKHGGQFGMEFLWAEAKPVVARLRFSRSSGRPQAWRPAKGVQLRPRIQFGQPCIADTRIPTSTIWGYIRGGDSKAFIARSYGLGVAEIDRALEWEERLRAADQSLATAA